MATVKVTREMVAKAMAETDWAAQDALTDEDIARQVAANPDATWRRRSTQRNKRRGLRRLTIRSILPGAAALPIIGE
jgi:hypothetical protein